MHEEKLEVGRFGKAVGLDGGLRFHLVSDFPEQLTSGAEFFLDDSSSVLVVDHYDPQRDTIWIRGVTMREEAQKLTNHALYSTLSQTLVQCPLKEDEAYWFEVVGMQIWEEGRLLGIVSDIQRIGAIDYLLIVTEATLHASGLAKEFLLPYIDRYVLTLNRSEKIITATGAQAILEAS